MSGYAGVHGKGAVSLMDILESVRANKNFQKAGALGIFIGVVRGETLDGKKVEKMELEAYEEKANESLKSICDDLRKREGIIDAQIHHLLGEFNVGEDLVYVVIAGVHRNNVFSALEEAVERYKKEAPIFKKEYRIEKEGTRKSLWISEG